MVRYRRSGTTRYIRSNAYARWKRGTRTRRSFGKWGKGKFARGVKKVVLKLAETKFLKQGPEIETIGNPDGAANHTFVKCLCDADAITEGGGNNQRIGNSIQLSGFKINMKVKNPIGHLATETGSELDVMSWTKLKWHIIKYKTAPTVYGANHFPDNVQENVKDFTLASQNQKLIFIKSGTINFSNSFTRDDENKKNNIKSDREYIINKYIKIDRKQDYTGGVAGDYRSNYYFICYAYASNQGFGTGGYWCNRSINSTTLDGSPYYHPTINLRWTTYFKDI